MRILSAQIPIRAVASGDDHAGFADRDPCQARRLGRGLAPMRAVKSRPAQPFRSPEVLSSNQRQRRWQGSCCKTHNGYSNRRSAGSLWIPRLAKPRRRNSHGFWQDRKYAQPSEPFPPPLRLDQLKEWALAPVKHAPESRVPFADNRLARVPLPTMPVIDRLPMAGLSLVTLKNASGDKPYDLVAVQLSARICSGRHPMVNRSNQGRQWITHYWMQAGGKANPVDFDTVVRKVIDPWGNRCTSN